METLHTLNASHPSPQNALQSLQYSRGSLKILNQLELPYAHNYEDASTCEQAHSAIKTMKVRGAPLIAITAALGLACELEKLKLKSENPGSQSQLNTVQEFREWLYNKLDFLTTSRPTAVNLFQVSNWLKMKFETICDNSSLLEIKKTLIQSCEQYYFDDLKINQSIGDHGAAIFEGQNDVTILTHCNTGSLATSGYGTALGVIRSLFSQNKLSHVYCTETRPYNQGARLTAYELVHEKIPATLVTDSMVSFLMKTRKISAVIVGADRIAANGDTANKIGTYQLAISALHHNIPFWVAAPTTSFDLSIASGNEIKIEERPMHELTHIGSFQIAAHGVNVWNPSFDITLAECISGFITEFGVIQKNNSSQFALTENGLKTCVQN